MVAATHAACRAPPPPPPPPPPSPSSTSRAMSGVTSSTSRRTCGSGTARNGTALARTTVGAIVLKSVPIDFLARSAPRLVANSGH
eukprot:SAG22_NODE_3165_length_1887_cov_1.673378_1_plen_85_part_00